MIKELILTIGHRARFVSNLLIGERLLQECQIPQTQ